MLGAQQLQPRIDLANLKTQIQKSVGLARSKLYFHYLNRFLSHKLSKPEFHKLCFNTLGRENMLLHNQLIRSILKNACYGNKGLKSVRNKYQSNAHVCSNGGSRQTEQSTARVPNGKKSVDLPSVQINSRDTKLIAPLGIPFPFFAPVHTRSFDTCSNTGDLLDSQGLGKRMEQIAGVHGLGVSVHCVNLLNSGLEMYLKQLIGSCIELVDARCGVEGTMQKTAMRKQLIETQRKHYPVSLVDFRIAMELNPQQLGQHWPLLLEKICMQQEYQD